MIRGGQFIYTIKILGIPARFPINKSQWMEKNKKQKYNNFVQK